MPRSSKSQVIVFLRNVTKWIGSVYLGSILLLCALNYEKLGRRRMPWREEHRKAVCGKTACTVVRPAKAGVVSRSQSCRGKSQDPVAWIAGWRETNILEPIDKTSFREVRVTGP